MVEPHSSNFRVITANVLGVRIFRNFTESAARRGKGHTNFFFWSGKNKIWSGKSQGILLLTDGGHPATFPSSVILRKCPNPILVHSLMNRIKLYVIQDYHKTPKNSDTYKICCSHPKIWTSWLYRWVMLSIDADRMANSVDPEQTAPVGAVWSGSTLFAQAYLSKNLGWLQ